MAACAPLDRVLDVIVGRGIPATAEGVSGLVGFPISISALRVVRVPVRDIVERLGGPEELVVAVYLLALGDVAGHIMLILPHQSALRLVDLLLGQPEGTTRQLTPLGQSALGEVGNISAAALLNCLAAVLGVEARPSPPAVIVDMAGAIMDIVVSNACPDLSDLFLLESIFSGPDRAIQVFFWVIPNGVSA